MKWAGGKRWLARLGDEIFPKTYETYLEPFLGSGAVFFALRPRKAILSDLNSRLISAYQEVRDNPTLVARYLRQYGKNHTKLEYYSQRSMCPRSPARAAAQFIYFNRVCFNGIYRVNLRGEFNVPLGTKTKVVLETDDFPQLSSFLRRAQLVAGDFEPTIDRAKAKDLIYIDPPYTTKHNLNGFVKYNEKIFSWDDQVRLAAALRRAHRRGAHIVVSNAFHDSVKELYVDFLDIREVSRANIIASESRRRGKISELVATNVS